MKENRENRGRPNEKTNEDYTDFSEDVLQKLEECFLQGLNNTEACLMANISQETFYGILRVNDSRKERFKLLKENTKVLAKRNIHNEIKKGDKETSKWYLERKDKEFKNKTDITTDDESINPLLVKFIGDDQQQGNKGNDNTNRIQETV